VLLKGGIKNDPYSVNAPVTNYTSVLSKDISKLVIGVNEDYFLKDVDDTVDQLVRKGIRDLEEMGAKIETVDIPSLQYSESALMVTNSSEISTIHYHNFKIRPLDFSEEVRDMLELGEAHSAIDYLQAQKIRHRLKVEFDHIFQRVDVLITPTLPFVLPEIGENVAYINTTKVDLVKNITRFVAPLI